MRDVVKERQRSLNKRSEDKGVVKMLKSEASLEWP
jgi:hypothetical protein